MRKQSILILHFLFFVLNDVNVEVIFLVSKIMDNANGASSELLGINSKNPIDSQPDYLMDALYPTNTIVDKSFLNKWTN